MNFNQLTTMFTSDVIYWLTIVCLSVSMLLSLRTSVVCLRYDQDGQRDKYWIKLIDSIVLYGSTIWCYAVGGFAEIYYFCVHLWDHRLTGVLFITAIVVAYHVLTLPTSILSCLIRSNKQNDIWITIKDYLFEILFLTIVFFGIDVALLEFSTFWVVFIPSLIVIFAILISLSDTIENSTEFHPLRYGVAILIAIVFSIGLIYITVFVINERYFNEAMGIYDNSIAVNMLGFIFVFIPIFKLLFKVYKEKLDSKMICIVIPDASSEESQNGDISD